MNRRQFLQNCGATGALATTSLKNQTFRDLLAASGSAETPMNGQLLPDEEWNLWIDQQARWEEDSIHLPESFSLQQLPVNPPSGGWAALEANRSQQGAAVAGARQVHHHLLVHVPAVLAPRSDAGGGVRGAPRPH